MIHLDRHPRLVIGGSPGRLGAVALVVAKDAPIRALSDLAGRRILVAAGASAELMLETWLSRAGLAKEGVDCRLSPGQGGEAADALLRAEADAAVLWDPWLAAALDSGGLRVVEQAPFWSVLLVDRRWAARPGRLVRYRAALLEALAWMAAHPGQAVEWTAARSGLSPRAVRATLAGNEARLGASPGLALGADLLARLNACEAYAVRNKLVAERFELAGRLADR
jgi:ABC-type nitrate/sulfonate/bicarbonate transport system substrate-binding protein